MTGTTHAGAVMSAGADVASIAATRTFYERLAVALAADVAQIELALANLADLDLDEQTLGDFQSAQTDAQRAAARCRATVTVLDTLHSGVEAAVRATPDAARIDFYREPGVTTAPPGPAGTSHQPAQASGTPGAQWRVDVPREPGILTLTDPGGSTEVEMTRDELFELVDVLDKLSQYGTSNERMKLERGGEICWGEDWDNPTLVNLTVCGGNDTSATLTLDSDALDDLRSKLNTQLRQQLDADERARAGGPPCTSQQVTSAGTTVEQTSGVGWSAGEVRKPGALVVTGDDGRVEVPMRRYEVSQFIDVLTQMGGGTASINRMELENGGDIWWGEWEEGDDGSLLLSLSVSGTDDTWASLALDPHALDDLRIHLKQQLADDAYARARAAGIAPGELNPDDLLMDDDEDTYAAAAAEHRKMANWFATRDQSDRDNAAQMAWWTRAADTLDAAAARAGQQPVQ